MNPDIDEIVSSFKFLADRPQKAAAQDRVIRQAEELANTIRREVPHDADARSALLTLRDVISLTIAKIVPEDQAELL